MLCVDSISTCASTCASYDSGRWTAIWSPSKSALKPPQTSGCILIALPSTSTGSKAWMPMRCRVGARFSSTGCWSMTSSRMSQTSGSRRSSMRLADLIVSARPCSLSADDERLEELQGDLLGQTALVQLELGADDDDRTGRVVDALAEQVLAEAALLALDHVGQRLERAVGRAEHRAAAATVVEERVDRLLQHPLLVADDDLGRVEVEQLLEAVVAVDDAAVEVVEVARREVAALQQHERAQVRRDHRDDVQDHPLGSFSECGSARRSSGAWTGPSSSACCGLR